MVCRNLLPWCFRDHLAFFGRLAAKAQVVGLQSLFSRTETGAGVDICLRRADVLLALGKDANTPTSDYVRTDSLMRTWELIVRHCGSALRHENGDGVTLHAETISKVLSYRFYWDTEDQGEGFVLEGGCIRYSEKVTTESLGLYGRLRHPRPEMDISKLLPRLRFVAPTLLYILAFVVTALVCGLHLTVLAIRPNPAGAVTGTLLAGFAILIYQSRIAPALKSKYDRISIVHERFTKIDAVPSALEYKRVGESRYVRVVNFTGLCVLCDSDVRLANGRNELKGRIVGECIESPLEHVYSFDRMTLEGVPLRAKPALNQVRSHA